MSYNGSGTFLINTAGQPVVSGTVISSTTFNTLTNDLANGLSTAITKDGQTTITNNIPFNGYKITNVGAGTAATDAVQLGQVQSGSFTALTVTGTDTYVASVTPVLPAYTTGSMFTFVVPNTNTGPATLNVSSLGAKVLSRDGSTALAAGDLVAGSEVIVVYDGTRFQVLNSNSKTNLTISGNATLSGGTANSIAYLNGSKVVTTNPNLSYSGTVLNITQTGSSTGLLVSATAANSAQISIYGNGASSGLYLQGGADGNAYINSQNSMFFVTNGLNRAAINSAGAVTISAPTSGNALTINSFGGTTSGLVVTGVASQTGANISTTTPSGTTNYWRLGQPGVVNWDIQNVATTGEFRITNGAQIPFQSSATGNVTINAPTSGVGLTVNGLSTGVDTAKFVASANGAQGQISFQVPAGTVGSLLWDNGTTLTGTANSVAFGGGAATTAIQTSSANRILVSGNGNVTINSPSSGIALTVNAVSGSQAAKFAGADAGSSWIGINNNAAGESGRIGDALGVIGSGAGDFAVRATANLSLATNSGVERIRIATAGNVTINAPTSGTSLALGSGSGVAWAAGQYAIQVGPIASVRGDGGTAAFSNNTYFDGTNWKYITTAAATRYEQNGGANTWLWAASGTGGTTAGTWNTSLNIGSAGNVTINAPASGNSLVVNAVAGGAAGAFYAPASNTCSVYLYGNNGAGLLLLQGGNDNNGYITASNTLYLASNNLSRVSLGTTGTVTVLAPTSGSGLVVNGSASTPPVAVTFSATAMTVNTNLSNVFTTTFTANVTTAPTISNPTDGQTINWFITQDATGTRTMTWPTSFKWPNGVAGVLSTAANAVDLVVATYRSSTGFWYASLAKGFA